MRKSILLLIFCVVFWAHITEAKTKKYTAYIIKPGDTISGILYSHKIFPLWTKNQWVNKVLELNRMDKQSAKEIKSGDVIILPVSTKYFKRNEIAHNYSFKRAKQAKSKDIVKRRSSARLKRKLKRKRKKHHISIHGEYFNRSTRLMTDQVMIPTNLGAIAKYEYKTNRRKKKLNWYPSVTTGVYTQQGARFQKSTELDAEFSPSYIVRASMGIYHKRWQFTVSPFVESDFFSHVAESSTFPGEFYVRKDLLIWTGGEIRKDIFYKDFRYFFGFEFAGTITSSNFSAPESEEIQTFQGTRTRFSAGLRYGRQEFTGFMDLQNLEQEDQYSHTSFGVRVGHYF